MAIPTTETADGKTYDFVPDKTVAVGDPTEAVADHDTLAENSDYDRAQSVAGWAASECGADYLRTVKNGSGKLYFWGTAQTHNVSGDNGFDLTLHDRTSIEIPADADLLSRDIEISGGCIFTKSGLIPDQGRATFMPGGSNDKFWNIPITLNLAAAAGFGGRFWSGDGDDAGIGNGLPTKYFTSEIFSLTYTGGGGTATYRMFVWVSKSDPNKLCMEILEDSNPESLDGVCVRLWFTYGPQWITP